MKEKKCWGEVEHGFNYPDCGTSYLQVEAGWRCSVHYHRQRDNGFRVLSGVIMVGTYDELWDGSILFSQNYISKGGVFEVSHIIPHFFGVLHEGVVLETYWSGSSHDKVMREDIIRFDVGTTWSADHPNPVLGKEEEFSQWWRSMGRWEVE